MIVILPLQQPKLRLDLLLYTNMGAEALAKYLKTTKVAIRRWKLGINDKPANATNAIGWGTFDQPQMNIAPAPAGRQGTMRRRRMEGSEKVAADVDRV